MSLSFVDAQRFVRDRLHINSNDVTDSKDVSQGCVSSVFMKSDDKLELLEKLIIAFQEHIPFQNLHNMAVKPGQRRAPSREEIKDDQLNGRGGLCISMNFFFCELLKALGYEAYIAGATVARPDEPDVEINHIVVIVRNVVKDGDIYLAEVGVALPTMRAVSLDFDTQSPEYRDSFQKYKYVRLSVKAADGHAVFAREVLGLGRDRPTSQLANTDADIDEKWTTKYTFSLEPITLERFAEYVNISVFSNMSWKYSREIIVLHWPHGRAAGVLKDRLVREDDQGRLLTAAMLNTEEEQCTALIEEFPVLSPDVVRAAVVISRSILLEDATTYRTKS